MRSQLTLVFLTSYLCAAFELSALQAELPDLRILAQEVLEECDPKPWPTEMAIDYLVLDVHALIYDIFLTLSNLGLINENNYNHLKERFKILFPEEFAYLIEERYSPYACLCCHPFANANTLKFQNSVRERFILTHAELMRALSIEVNTMDLKLTSEFALDILIKLANKGIMRHIVKSWNLSASEVKKDQGCQQQ